jgi:hypothetical protein
MVIFVDESDCSSSLTVFSVAVTTNSMRLPSDWMGVDYHSLCAPALQQFNYFTRCTKNSLEDS